MNSAPATSKSPAILGTGILLLSIPLLVPLPFAPSTPFGMALLDALHFPLFAVLTALGYAFVRVATRRPPGPALTITVSLAVIAAILSELGQSLFDRTSSWRDFGFDLLGIATAATAIALVLRPGRPPGARAVAGSLALLTFSLTVASLPAWRAAKAQAEQAQAFPVLGSFEESWEMLFWHPQGNPDVGQVTVSRQRQPVAHSGQGGDALRIEADSASWAGVHLLIARPISWSGHQALHFDLFNPAEDDFELGIRVDDREGRRFTGAARIKPGANRCRVPLAELANRERSLGDSAGLAPTQLTFHLDPLPSTRTFYLDNVQLE